MTVVQPIIDGVNGELDRLRAIEAAAKRLNFDPDDCVYCRSAEHARDCPLGELERLVKA